MKKIILLIIAALAMSACMRTLYSEERIAGNFKPYTEIGFFLSPTETTEKEYTPVAVIEIRFYPGDKAKTKEVKPSAEPKSNLFSFKRDPEQIVEWERISPNYDEMLTKLVGYAVELCANGIINLSITEIRDVKGNLRYKTASGFAIKIKK